MPSDTTENFESEPSNGSISLDEHDTTWYRRYWWGCYVGILPPKELKPGIDPWDPTTNSS